MRLPGSALSLIGRGRCGRPASPVLSLLMLAFLLGPGPALADALDEVPLDTRARLAAAASAYPPDQAPSLDPASAGFAPDSATNYLETDQDGHYGSSTFEGDFQVHFTVIRFPDAQAAAAGLETWKGAGDAVTPLDWDGRFPAFRRGQGLLGLSMLGGGTVARGQSGRWHFEVSAVPQGAPGQETGPAELEAVVAALWRLAENATLYRLSRELTVDYTVAGQTRRLREREPFQIPLQAGEETEARLRLQLLDDGRPVGGITYRVELGGPLADLAELVQDGARSRRVAVEAHSTDGSPVEMSFVFPPAISVELSRLIDSGELSVSLAVEARTPETVLP
jgi:hypothetical protein